MKRRKRVISLSISVLVGLMLLVLAFFPRGDLSGILLATVAGCWLLFMIGLFIYRQATYATYTTLSSTKFEQKIENKDSFILVAGDSSDNTMKSFQEVMTTYQTKNRKNKLYYVDTKGKSSDYLTKKLNVNVSTPCTFIIKNGKVTAKYPGALQYYYFKDFINANL